MSGTQLSPFRDTNSISGHKIKIWTTISTRLQVVSHTNILAIISTHKKRREVSAFTERFWTFSIKWMSRCRAGFHMVEAYSKWGRTNCLYNFRDKFYMFITTNYCLFNECQNWFCPFNNFGRMLRKLQIKIKSSLYSPYYAEACNEWRGPSPRLSAWATQLRRNVATVANRWRHCADLTGPGIEPQTSRTDSVRWATELTAGCCCENFKFANINQDTKIFNNTNIGYG